MSTTPESEPDVQPPAAAAAAASAPARKPKIDAKEQLIELLNKIAARQEEPFNNSVDAQRVVIFEEIVKKMEARKLHENYFVIRSNDDETLTYRMFSDDNKAFVKELMEMRGWKMTDFGNSLRFEIKPALADAREFAKRLGWV